MTTIILCSPYYQVLCAPLFPLMQRGETNAYYETGCVVEKTPETNREASLEEVYVF